MENIFKVQKTADIVLPSGVAAQIKGLEGKHQALITVQDDKKRAEGLKTMLWDCLVSIGDKHSIDDGFIDKLTSFDRKFLLWEIRKLSNDDIETFTFDYEFPATDNRKLKQRYVIEFNNHSFPVIPAKWVREPMFEIYKAEHGLKELSREQELDCYATVEFPVIYESYERMMEENHVNNITLPECQVDIFWHLSTGKDEDVISKLVGNSASSHTQLQMRKPMYENKELSKQKEKKIVQPVPLDDLANKDIEALRKDIMAIEGSVDSLVVVQHDSDSSKVAHVDLLQTPAFFFASLAL